MARSVLNARSDFSIALMTPATSSVLPVARSWTAWLASCWSLATSLMLSLSMSEKLAPPTPSPPVLAGLTAPAPPATFPRDRLLLTPSIMGSRDQPEGRGDHGLARLQQVAAVVEQHAARRQFRFGLDVVEAHRARRGVVALA